MSYVEPLLAQDVQFAWEPEATYLTRPTNINNFIKVEQGTLELPMPVRETEEVYAHGSGRVPNYVNDQKKQTLDGAFSYEVVTGEFLGAIFGKVVTTGTDPYEHIITVLDSMHPSFAVQAAALQPNTANVIQEYLGCRVSAATFKSSEDSERLMCDVEYMAAKYQDGGTTEETVAADTNPPFTFKEGAISSTALWTGAKARVHDIEWKINLNTKPSYAAGYEYYPYDILPGKVSFGELKLVIGIEDDTEWDEILAAPGTVYDYSVLFNRGTNDDLTVSGNAKLKSGPWKLDEHEIRADLVLVPETMAMEVNDSIAAYPFE